MFVMPYRTLQHAARAPKRRIKHQPQQNATKHKQGAPLPPPPLAAPGALSPSRSEVQTERARGASREPSPPCCASPHASTAVRCMARACHTRACMLGRNAVRGANPPLLLVASAPPLVGRGKRLAPASKGWKMGAAERAEGMFMVLRRQRQHRGKHGQRETGHAHTSGNDKNISVSIARGSILHSSTSCAASARGDRGVLPFSSPTLRTHARCRGASLRRISFTSSPAAPRCWAGA